MDGILPNQQWSQDGQKSRTGFATYEDADIARMSDAFRKERTKIRRRPDGTFDLLVYSSITKT